MFTFNLFLILSVFVLYALANEQPQTQFFDGKLFGDIFNSPEMAKIVDDFTKQDSELQNGTGDGEEHDSFSWLFDGDSEENSTESDNRGDSEEQFDVQNVISTYRTEVSSKTTGEIDYEVDSLYHLSGTDMRDHARQQFEILYNLTKEANETDYSGNHEECKKKLKKWKVNFQVYQSQSVSADDSDIIKTNFRQVKSSYIQKELIAYNLTLIEIENYQTKIQTQIATLKILIIRGISTNTSDETLNASLKSNLTRLSEIQETAKTIKSKMYDLEQKLQDQDTDIVPPPTLTVTQVHRYFVENKDAIITVTDSIKVCDESVEDVNVTVSEGDDSHFELHIVITYDPSVSTEDDIGKSVIVGLVGGVNVDLEDLIVEKQPKSRRGILDFVYWKVLFQQSNLTVNVTEKFSNMTTNIVMPSLTDDLRMQLTEEVVKIVQKWISDVKQLSVDELKVILEQLQNERNEYCNEKNRTKCEFEQFVEHYESGVNDYWTKTQNFILRLESSSGSSDNDQPESQKRDADTENDEDYNIASQMSDDKIDRINCTLRTILYEKQQCKIDALGKIIVVVDIKISLVNLYILIKSDPTNQTLINQIVVLEAQLNQTMILQYLKNSTFEDYESLVSYWTGQVESAKESSKYTLERIAKKEFKKVGEVKSEWKTKKEDVKSSIAKSFSDYLNCSVKSSNFDDLDSDKNGLTLQWVLELQSSTSPDTVSTLIRNVLFTEGGVSKNDIQVTTVKSAKRSTTVTSTATLSSSTSTTPLSDTDASTNTDYIIGGVIGGILFLAIIIAVVFILRKNRAERA